MPLRSVWETLSDLWRDARSALRPELMGLGDGLYFLLLDPMAQVSLGLGQWS